VLVHSFGQSLGCDEFRAIRVRGRAELLPDEQVTAYFRERPWGSRISAWASQQSEPIQSRAELEAAYERYAAQFPDQGPPEDLPGPGCGGGLPAAYGALTRA